MGVPSPSISVSKANWPRHAAGLRHRIPKAAALSDPTEPSNTLDFINHDRPPVPAVTVPRGLVPFHLADKPVRGRLVRLGALADALLSRKDNSVAVNALAGQALALTAGLAGALKYKGSFSLQAKGDGAVPMLLADCTDAGELRGYARPDEERLAALVEAHGISVSARHLLGKGYLAFTVDQGEAMDRYQGIVGIDGETLTEMTGHYFETSEQLQTFVKLAAAPTPSGWRASAFIMERVAGEGGIDAAENVAEHAEAWNTAVILASTLTDEELLDDHLPSDKLLHRLFHAEGLILDRPKPLSYGCRCSRSKLAGVLANFPGEDLDHMAVDGVITMTCEFCNVDFRFERENVRAMAGRA
ncbi:Hsp33 family molecular chaperone HslO [Acetobacteraceae bacterium H6797]|nr:Hsp33 family molecular chaperone HslO [Acetobacteraceae bacterium H6797]